jgi:hypothetical protein
MELTINFQNPLAKGIFLAVIGHIVCVVPVVFFKNTGFKEIWGIYFLLIIMELFLC